MKIGELAQIAKCTVETVRYYEQTGLLPTPDRTAANYRSYGEVHVERLCFIRNCRTLDMTHEEIRKLLGLMDQPPGDCGGVNQLVDEHIVDVETRIDELLALKRQLHTLREHCQQEQSMSACGILHELTTMKTAPLPRSHPCNTPSSDPPA